MGSSFVRGREPAGNAYRDAERLHERGQAVLQLLVAHSDFFGQRPAGLNRLEKHLCQGDSGWNAGIGYFRRKDYSTLRIHSDCNRGAGVALALLPNRCAAVCNVELHHYPHGIVLGMYRQQRLFRQPHRHNRHLRGKN